MQMNMQRQQKQKKNKTGSNAIKPGEKRATEEQADVTKFCSPSAHPTPAATVVPCDFFFFSFASHTHTHTQTHGLHLDVALGCGIR